MAMRGQTSIEFLLILSAVVLVILAGVMSLSEIAKMQQSAYSATSAGVENASAGLLTYLSNETAGTGFYPISGGFTEFTNASLISLEITKSEPYFLFQPSVITLTAWNNYPAPMKIPRLVISVVNSSGNATQLSTSEEDNVTVILSHMLVATFVPSAPGVYNVTAVAQDDNGSVLVNPDTNQSAIVTANFTVLDARQPSSGVIKTFNLDRDVVSEWNFTHLDSFSLPQDAVIYSAILEITDSHLYENRNAGAQASYHYSSISECYCPQGTTCSIQGVISSDFFSQQGTVEIPEKSFVTSATYSTNNLAGDSAKVFINGQLNPIALNVIKTGKNVISLSIYPTHNTCPPPPPTSSYESYLASGDATLAVNYYAPSTSAASADEVIGTMMVNSEHVDPSAVVDISNYMKGGVNSLAFYNLQGIFSYKLVVSYA